MGGIRACNAEGVVATLEHKWDDEVDLKQKHKSVEALLCRSVCLLC